MQNGPVLGAVTALDGVVIVAHGIDVDFFDAATGNTLFRFTDSRSSSAFCSAPAVAQGMVFQGNLDGYFYAFGL